MWIQGNLVHVYDVEIFPNAFHCSVKNTETQERKHFEISNRRNQLKELVDFFYYSPDAINRMFCGYNNHHYDDVIINYIIDYYYVMDSLPYDRVCESLFNLSQTIVNAEEGDTTKFKRWKYAHYFLSMDLLTMLFSSKLRVGLKTMQATMHYKNVQEYDGDFEKPISDDCIDEMISYNDNDVDSTEELLNRLSKDIELRLYIQKEYGLNCLSMDKTKIGEKILEKKYCEATKITTQQLKQLRSPADYVALKDVILPFIKYKNPKLQEVLEDMKRQVVCTLEQKGYENKFVVSDTSYSVGVGGIHSINKPRIYFPKEDEYIGHSDVASMYPSFIIKYKWIPRHLGEEFWRVYSQIYDERIEAKHSGQALKNDVLKYALNAVTGKMQQKESWMYDPFSVFKIRINGQLILLMLVDRLLELNCKIVQINTDGVMYVAKKTNKDKVQELISEVEQLTQLTFESDNYEAFYQYAINDYFGIKEGYSQSHDPKLIEKKGMFITDTSLGKGLAPVIIPKAVINYFLTKEPVSEFIKNDKDIKDFLMSQAVNKKFKVIHGDKPVQRINRFYASTDGPYLFKKDNTLGSQGDGLNNMLTKSGVTILNKFDDRPIEDRKINYRYYISEAQKIIADFTEQQLELFW